MPFNAFSILLEEPLKLDDEDGRIFDVILIHRYGTEKLPCYALTLIPQTYATYIPIPIETRERIERLVRQQNAEGATRIMKSAAKNLPPLYCTNVLEAIPPEEVPEGTKSTKDASSLLDDLEQDTLQSDRPDTLILMTALRLALGLGHYILNFPQSQSGDGTHASPSASRLPLRVITKGAHVCTIEGTFKLTREERSVLRDYASGREISSPFFREGYYSRPIGLGSDPTAKRTVWHRPTIVRRDLLPEGTLPQGKEAILPNNRKT
jgi:hypothetical protein